MFEIVISSGFTSYVSLHRIVTEARPSRDSTTLLAILRYACRKSTLL